jgi:hypothetical protein
MRMMLEREMMAWERPPGVFFPTVEEGIFHVVESKNR